jgi:hypothetical protein
MGQSINDRIPKAVELRGSKQITIGFEQIIKKALAVAGSFSSGFHYVSAHHDDHLAEAFKK